MAKSNLPPAASDPPLSQQERGRGIDPILAAAIVEIVDALNAGDMIAVATLEADYPEASALLSRAFEDRGETRLSDETINHWRSSY